MTQHSTEYIPAVYTSTRFPGAEHHHPPPPSKTNTAYPAEPHLPESLGLDPRHLLLSADAGDPEVSLGDEVLLAPPHATELPIVEPKPRLSSIKT